MPHTVTADDAAAVSAGLSFISKQRAAARYGYSPGHLMRMVRIDPSYPRPVRLSPRSTVFVEQEIDEHVTHLMATQRLHINNTEIAGR